MPWNVEFDIQTPTSTPLSPRRAPLDEYILVERYASKISPPRSPVPDVHSESLGAADREAIYQTLDAGAREIRLLRLQTKVSPIRRESGEDVVRFELTKEFLDDPALEYDAISYAWAAPTYSSTIVVNGRVMGVTTNLFDALILLSTRELLTRAIWIDAVCINQADSLERGQQVSLMEQIYRQADTVHICLGNGTSQSPETIDSLTDLASGTHANTLIAARQLTNAHLRDLFICPWWTRVWVLQEAVLARNPIAHWGSTTVSFPRLMLAANVARDAKLNGLFDAEHETKEDQPSEWLDTFDWAVYSFTTLKNKTVTPEMVLSVSSNLETADHRDRIYGVLALLPSLPSVKPDYTLQWLVRKAAYRRKGPAPSWVPDFRETGGLIGVHKDEYGSKDVDLSDLILLEEVGIRGLRVNALLVDEIKKIGVPMQALDQGPGGFSNLGSDLQERFRQLLRTWLNLVPLESDTVPMDVQAQMNDRHLQQLFSQRRSFWRTILCDGLFELVTRVQTRDVDAVMRKYDQWLFDDREDAMLSSYELQRLEMLIGSSVFFVTTTGRLGLSRSAVLSDDIVALLAGETIPYILRRCPGTTSEMYHVVGSSFCDGLMYGEKIHEMLASTEGQDARIKLNDAYRKIILVR